MGSVSPAPKNKHQKMPQQKKKQAVRAAAEMELPLVQPLPASQTLPTQTNKNVPDKVQLDPSPPAELPHLLSPFPILFSTI
jgi:hypothetical protein